MHNEPTTHTYITLLHSLQHYNNWYTSKIINPHKIDVLHYKRKDVLKWYTVVILCVSSSDLYYVGVCILTYIPIFRISWSSKNHKDRKTKLHTIILIRSRLISINIIHVRLFGMSKYVWQNIFTYIITIWYTMQSYAVAMSFTQFNCVDHYIWIYLIFRTFFSFFHFSLIISISLVLLTIIIVIVNLWLHFL